MTDTHLPVRSSQRGAALITALVFLGVITLLSVTSMRESTMGVRMAQNEEARLSGIQSAQALTEAVDAPAKQVLMVGDTLESDVVAAAAAGLPAVLIDRSAATSTEHRCISRLQEVLDLL